MKRRHSDRLPPRVATIGLMGPFGYGNLGDAVMIDAVIQNLRERDPNIEVQGFSLNPEDTERRHDIDSFPLSRMSWKADERVGSVARISQRMRSSENPLARRLERVARRVPAEFGMLVRSYRALEGVDALLACGSGQLQDLWGGGGPWSYPYTMLRWAILSRLRGTKFMVVSVGAGPVDSWLSRRFFLWALNLAVYRSYRDEWTKAFVRDQIGVRANDPVCPDLAFSSKLPNSDETKKGPERQGRSREIIGLGPIGYLRRGNWPSTNDSLYKQYLHTMATFAEMVISDGRSILFIKGEALYDQEVIDDIVAELRSRGGISEDHLIESPMIDAADLLEAIARCDAVVTARFHGALLSYCLDRPVLGLSYQAKTESLMEEFQQAQFCMPIGAADAQTMYEKLISLLHEPKPLPWAHKILPHKRQALDDQYDLILASL
jgi:polysaccharide pyruvyl transferase WcaK-like protein